MVQARTSFSKDEYDIRSAYQATTLVISNVALRKKAGVLCHHWRAMASSTSLLQIHCREYTVSAANRTACLKSSSQIGRAWRQIRWETQMKKGPQEQIGRSLSISVIAVILFARRRPLLRPDSTGEQSVRLQGGVC